MAIEQKERYIVTMEDGRQMNVVCGTIAECVVMFGEENITRIEKLPYEDLQEKTE